MTLLNTSFHMHRSVESDFLEWMKTRYAIALEQHGGMGCPTFAKVLVITDPDTVSYCFQMTAASEEQATAWHDSSVAKSLRDELTVCFGESLVHFTTYMEIMPLR